ncbi:hypothetical protein BT67DRAFT_167953 [Trichocladium antarcticum]|uniref:Uncharacterized protein n=1 Tax=Trichocladium antarcticum TaxID=1450529 RepID=A0AAN6UDM1_9PEZI|nr:hypothetical protein BT67DRAFT_167953 [Trichocladium antarcticum]
MPSGFPESALLLRIRAAASTSAADPETPNRGWHQVRCLGLGPFPQIPTPASRIHARLYNLQFIGMFDKWPDGPWNGPWREPAVRGWRESRRTGSKLESHWSELNSEHDVSLFPERQRMHTIHPSYMW